MPPTAPPPPGDAPDLRGADCDRDRDRDTTVLIRPRDIRAPRTPLARLLYERKISARKFAGELGIVRSVMYRYTAGSTKPQYRRAEQIANALGVLTTDLWPDRMAPMSEARLEDGVKLVTLGDLAVMVERRLMEKREAGRSGRAQPSHSVSVVGMPGFVG